MSAEKIGDIVAIFMSLDREDQIKVLSRLVELVPTKEGE